ncbi:hypothetical protein KI387_028074, partial [Taxus chinensis]
MIQTGSQSSWKWLESIGSGIRNDGSGNNKLDLEIAGFYLRLVFSFILEAF